MFPPGDSLAGCFRDRASGSAAFASDVEEKIEGCAVVPGVAVAD